MAIGSEDKHAGLWNIFLLILIMTINFNHWMCTTILALLYPGSFCSYFFWKVYLCIFHLTKRMYFLTVFHKIAQEKIIQNWKRNNHAFVVRSVIKLCNYLQQNNNASLLLFYYIMCVHLECTATSKLSTVLDVWLAQHNSSFVSSPK